MFANGNTYFKAITKVIKEEENGIKEEEME